MTHTSIWGTPGFCSSGSVIYLAYSHMGDSGSPGAAFYDRVFVFKWTAASHWSAMNGGSEVSVPYTGSPPSADAWEPAVGCAASVSRSPPLSRNSSAGSYETSVRTVGVALDGSGNTYLAQWEQHHADSSRNDLFVSRYSSGSFTSLGGSLGQDYVCRYDGAWTLLGGGPVSAFAPGDHYDSGNPDILVAGGRLFLAWEESDLYDGDKLNTDPLNQAADPDLAYSASDGYLYVAFEENTDGWPHIFVRRKDLSP